MINCRLDLNDTFVVNKRLDEWVMEDSLDTRKVHFPRKDGKDGSNTGMSTPKKLSIGGGGVISRPSSPVNNAELLNGNAVLAAAIQKRINRLATIFSKIL